MVIVAPRLLVLPERATLEDIALSAALDGPAWWLLEEEPQPELVEGFVAVEPAELEELLPQLLPEELRDEEPHPLPEELREEPNEEEDECPPENPLPPPPRAKLSEDGQTMAAQRISAAKRRTWMRDE